MDDFGDLISPEAWNRMVSAGRIARFPAGRVLMAQGAPADQVLLLTSGRVRVSRREPDGETLLLAVRRAPQLIGELGLYGDKGRTATVVAIDPCTTVQLTPSRFTALIRELKLEADLMRHLTFRLCESESLRTELSMLAAAPRVARFLHRLALLALPGDDGLEVGIGQTDLASAVGLSRQTVAVEMRKLRGLEIIQTSRSQIIVRDLERLADLAGI
ncbi:hypothetical protein GCM10017673_48520 [Streptosporangium violaceochromogenes]|nr:hypothetical protein GCM10017673_48520 [Streptosporangium violaceochromogenes]